jgi:hypothetical protein
MHIDPISTVIIGAGVAGLACAQALQEAGHSVLLLDKGRGPGGRLSTRRAETPLGELRFDHGAQFITARDPEFTACLHGLEAAGFAALWEPVWAPGSLGPDSRGPDGQAPQPRWTGLGGMNAIVKGLARALDVRWGVQATGVVRTKGGQLAVLAGGEEVARARHVAVAVPAEQVPTLIEPLVSQLAAAARAVPSDPCWAVMAVFGDPVPVDWDVWRGRDGPLALAARETSRPGRAAGPGAHRWVLHAGADWSRVHLEEDGGAVAAQLVAEFRALSGASAPVWQAAHRWRFAQVAPARPLARPFDAASGIGVCGDWCQGPRVEAAWLSGRALAREMLARSV